MDTQTVLGFAGILLGINGACIIVLCVAYILIGSYFRRDSRRETREWTAQLNEQLRRYLERRHNEHQENLRQMDAHIAMVLERVDRTG